MQISKILNTAINSSRKTSKTIKQKVVQHSTASTPDIKLIQHKIGLNVFDIALVGGKKVGLVDLELGPDEVMKSFYQKGSLPESWFKNGVMKNFIEVLQIHLLEAQRQGLGRKTMQKIYELSKSYGCEGRIHLDALDEAKGFYSKLGFDIPPVLKARFDKIYAMCLQEAKKLKLSKTEFLSLLKQRGVPEIVNGKYNVGGSRFFEPTSENLQSLYKI